MAKWLKQWVEGMKRRQPRGHSFARSLSEAITASRAPGEGTNYRGLAELMTETLAQIAWVSDSDKVKYLRPILQLTRQQGQLTVATLNYDNTVELLCEASGIEVERGLESWSEEGTFRSDKGGVFLLKLHGSIDWALIQPGQTLERPMARPEVRPVTAEAVGRGYKPAVVFGQRNKLTAEGPFLDLLSAFRRELARAEELVIVGYSFRDAHVNEYISQWINADATRRIVVLDPSFTKSRIDYAVELMRHARSRLRVIEEPAELALSSLFADDIGVAEQSLG